MTSEMPNWALQRAIREADIGGIRAALAAGADLNQSPRPDELYPLSEAAATGRVEIVEFLHGRGAPLNAGSPGQTPLWIALTNRRFEIMEWLLIQGCDFEPRNAKGWTPLHYASGYGLAEETRLLLQNGANVHVQTPFGATPLHFATTPQSLSLPDPLGTIDALLEAGADPNARDQLGRTPRDRVDERLKSRIDPHDRANLEGIFLHLEHMIGRKKAPIGAPPKWRNP